MTKTQSSETLSKSPSLVDNTISYDKDAAAQKDIQGGKAPREYILSLSFFIFGKGRFKLASSGLKALSYRVFVLQCSPSKGLTVLEYVELFRFFLFQFYIIKC